MCHQPSRLYRWMPLLRFALLVAACAVTACAPAPGNHAAGGATGTPAHRTLGRDGGLRLGLRAACPPLAASCGVAAALPATLTILRKRSTDGLGNADAVVYQNGASDVVVELPGERDILRSVEAMTTPGHVVFLDTARKALPLGMNVSAQVCTTSCGPGQFPAVFTGEQVDPASVSTHVDAVTGQGYVVLAFAGDNQKRFTDYTHSHLGQYLTVTRDGTVVESAQIADIVPGPTEITGLPTEQDALLLAAYLKDGALPLSLTVVDEALVAPTR